MPVLGRRPHKYELAAIKHKDVTFEERYRLQEEHRRKATWLALDNAITMLSVRLSQDDAVSFCRFLASELC